MTTILWTIYWTGFTMTLLQATMVALLDRDHNPHVRAIAALITAALWPIPVLREVLTIIRLARVKDNG